MDIYTNKYLKYKNKYFSLKKQLGGNNFYFSVYVFTREALDEERICNMISLLTTLYGGTISVIKNKEESAIPVYEYYYWNEAVRYISDKSTNEDVSYYKHLTQVTSFVINNVPKELDPMNGNKLSDVEYAVRDQLYNFNLGSLGVPAIKGGHDPGFSKGWGFFGPKLALITLVERNLK